MAIVEEKPAITGWAGTHSENHVAAALDPLGGLLGTREFPRPRPATPATRLIRSFKTGVLDRAAIEATMDDLIDTESGT